LFDVKARKIKYPGTFAPPRLREMSYENGNTSGFAGKIQIDTLWEIIFWQKMIFFPTFVSRF
jgi:hypothetical protein